MYINIATSRLLTPIYCTHTEIFLKEAEIILTEVNITFEECDEILQYDSENALNELCINENWKSQNQVIIDQRKKQLE